MKTPRITLRRHAVAFAALVALAGAAQAQISTATIKGQVAGSSAGTAVTAVNKATGNTWRTQTLADGSYALTGLAPGTYEIRVGSAAAAETITVQVGQTAALDLGASAQQITIVGAATRRDVKTSEVGTNVSRRDIETTPQSTRNFLSSADLAPGVTFTIDNSGYTRIQSGSQNFDHVNVFIDGVSQKNNILRGGLVGQDVSRGNPFPQSAIAEYKVISSNYKAEFEQVSSVAITAVTKSGTNELHGEVYGDRTGTNWRAMSVFEKEREAAGVPLLPSTKYEYGASLGGAIVKDKLHYFLAYDGKNIQDSRQVVGRNFDTLPDAGIVPSLRAQQGNQVDDFREHLFFGKLDAQLSDDQRLSASVKLRREDDRVPEDKALSVPGNDKKRVNNETRFDLKHEWQAGSWLSEARAGYEDSVFNPKSASTTPWIKYKNSSNSPSQLDGAQDVIFTGGSPDAQRRQQKAFSLSEDLTYTGLAGHVMKGGAKWKAMKYDLSGTSRSVDIVETVISRTTGNAFFDGTNCLLDAANPTDGFLVNTPAEQRTVNCRIQRALAPARAAFDNNQIGLYFQDDWALTKQFELNLGMRWDYETNMLNNDYVTPADRVTALKALDTPRYGITPPAGQTYAQSLAKGGINIDDYIATGNRKSYKGAVAPRIGGSYDLTGDRATVVFGGWGRAYDRAMANHALDELQKNQQANGEIWMIRNDLKMPYADQMSIGLRQAVGEWNVEATLQNIRAKNQFVWFLGNRDANGGFANQSPIDPLWGGPDGYGSLILGDTVGQTKTNALLLRVEKPYTKASGWSANVAYTYSDAKTTHREWNNDIFDFTYGKPGQGGWKPSTLVEKHRIVAAASADNLLPWGITVAGKLTYGSGYPRRIVSCAAGFSNCITVEGDAPAFRQLDASLTKEITFGQQSLAFRMDVLNLFNVTNYGGFDDWGGGPVATGNPSNAVGGDNLTLGKPNATRGDTRTLRVALSYKF